MRLHFYGASDDLIEVDGDLRQEHVPSSDYGRFHLAPADDVNGGVHIHLRYEDTGCWSIGISPVDEDVPAPAGWTFELIAKGGSGQAPRYSAVLFFTSDDDVYLTWEERA